MQTCYAPPTFPYLVNFQTDAAIKVGTECFSRYYSFVSPWEGSVKSSGLRKEQDVSAHESQGMESFTGDCDPSPFIHQ